MWTAVRCHLAERLEGAAYHRHGDAEERAEALVRHRRRVHPADASRGRRVPVQSSYPRTRPSEAVCKRRRRVRRAARLVADSRSRRARPVARSALLRRADSRDVAHSVQRHARRKSRRVLSDTPPEPSDGLDRRCAAWALELCLAREAQRRPSHVYERRRLRRRYHAGAPRKAGASTASPPLVPAAALLHLGDVLRDGAPLADRRRCRRLHSREHRDEHIAHASPLGSRRSPGREGDLRRAG